MSQNDPWSPDIPSGDHPFEQGDEALDEATGLDPDFIEAIGMDPSLDPTLQVDERELAETSAVLDDPESLAMLDGGIDDPDGLGAPTAGRQKREADEEGWDLDAPQTPGTTDDPDIQAH